MSESPFWLVWTPNGQTEPKVRFPTRKAATGAARWMTKKYGTEFFVLKAQSRHDGYKNKNIAPWGVGAPPPQLNGPCVWFCEATLYSYVVLPQARK